MRSLNGFLQVLDNNSIDRANLKVIYDFAESGNIVNKAPNYSGQFSGLFSGNATTFFAGTGSGFAQSELISIDSGVNLFSESFTHFFTIQRQQTANDNLFSCMGENVQATSGYAISLNNAGRCVFAYKDCTGPKSLTTPYNINLYSHIAISKQSDVVNMYQYTPSTNILDKHSDTVNTSEIFTSSYADLLFANTSPVGFLKDYFSGYIDDYIYFNVGLSPTQVMAVVSGLYANLVVVSTGSCGSVIDGIFVMPTGASSVATVTVPTAASLNRNGIVLLRPLPSNSIVTVDYATGTDNITWNKLANYETLTDDFFLQDYSTIPPIVYLNGVRSISGLSAITGLYCATGRAFERDYQFSGSNRIADAGAFDFTDTIVYDVPDSRNVWQKLYSGSQGVNIGAGITSGKVVHLNGIRFTSGRDYTTAGSILTPVQSITSGDMLCIDYFEGGYEKLEEIYTTEFFNTSGAYAQGTSRVYVNGQRQALSVDYLETTSGTLLNGAPISQPGDTVVVIDSMQVWNI